ncbi:MAG: nucleotide-binding protein [Methanoregulaceae archaeon]|nr:nucleotide-binding protein [Methanoregulaceae archaeon]
MATDRNGSPSRVEVLLDANALMAQVQFRLDVFESLGNLIGAYIPLILPEVLEELRGLSQSRGKEGSAARAALVLAKRCTQIESGLTEGTVDEKILYYANTHGCMVVTSDRNLRSALLGQHITVISLSGKQKMEIFRN